ncbi:BTAD domain-containing putative transcriptional regulator [Phytomonospora sp. NPDC050363]|uniref:AfsR/SARP family transcriptional regulator n=1 Tax=Phytomonospora sp. NPDC050363 TaxID=3155642 RepID=UPI00340E50E1
MTTDSTPRFDVLGPTALRAGETEIPLGGIRSRAVFAALVWKLGRTVPSEELIDLIWGEQPPRTAANQLQIAVHGVRTALAAAGLDAHRTLRRQDGGYVLDPPARVVCDLAEFRRATAAGENTARDGDWPAARGHYRVALAHWRGAAFQDIPSLAESAPATALAEEHLGAVESRMVADLVTGDHAAVLAEAAGPLAESPLRERIRHLLILAHALAGDTERALAEYRRVRRALAEELGLDPGPELTRLADDVRDGDTAGAVGRIRGWVTGPSSAAEPARPMELPARIRDFVGRGRELARIGAALGEDGAVVTVSGIGGLGKTALAVRAAEERLADFPGGCLFVDLRGADEEPQSPYRAQRTLLTSLGVPDPVIPSDEARRSELYAAVLAERRVLVVLDNAFDAGQVRPLTPAGRSAFLVTSRSALSDLRADLRIGLDVLNDEEAADLLSRFTSVAPGDAETLRELMSLTGRLPLALRIIGARIARRRDLDLPGMAARLADEQRRLDRLTDGDRRIRSCIAVGYGRLGPAAAAMLCAMASLPVADCSLDLIAEMTATTVDEARRLADELAEAELLRADGRHPRLGERYVAHDLVRVYARGEEGDTRAARRRGYRLLVHLVSVADAHLGYFAYIAPDRDQPAPPGAEAAIARAAAHPGLWFTVERELLVGAVADAAVLGEADTAWRLSAGLTNAFDHRDLADDLARLQEATEPLRPGLGPDALAALDCQKGALLRARGRHREMVPLLRSLRRRYLALGEPARAGAVAADLANAYLPLDRRRLAEATLNWARATLASAEPQSPAVSAQRGIVEYGSGNHAYFHDREAAGRHFAAAHVFFREAADRSGEAAALSAMGAVAQHLGDIEGAIELQNAAISVATRSGDVVGLLNIRHVLSGCHTAAGDHATAAAINDEVIRAVREFRHDSFLARALQRRAVIRNATGSHTEAVAACVEGIEVARHHEHALVEQTMTTLLAESYLGAGRLDEAEDAARRSLELLPDRSGRRYEDVRELLDKIEDARDPA